MGGERRKPTGGRGKGEEDPPLHVAARAGDMVTVRALCSSNPLTVNARDRHSRTPLHLAAWAGQEEVVRYLCSQKADVGAAAMDDMAAIHFASQKGHVSVARELLSAGASVRATNRKGWTPLHLAVKGSYLDLAKFLIRKGADLAAKTNSGETPLDLANQQLSTALYEYEAEIKRERESKTVVPKPPEDKKDGEQPLSRPAKRPRVVLSHLTADDEGQAEDDE
ncbi:ankyrin repeat family protein [Wolffia australiana]